MLAVVLATGGIMSAQDQAKVEKAPAELELEQRVRLAELRAKLAKAEKEAFDAEQSVLKSQTPGKAEQDEAVAAKAIAEAERDAIKARRESVAGPTLTAPTGDVTTNDAIFIETRVLAHTAAQSLMKTLATVLKDIGATAVVIHNDQDIASLSQYAVILEQGRLFRDSFKEALGEANNALTAIPGTAALFDPLLIPTAAAGLTRSVADLMQLFRTTTDLKGQEVSIDNETLVALLQRELRSAKQTVTVFYPSLYPIDVLTSSGAVSPLSELVKETAGQREAATTLIPKLDGRSAELTTKQAEIKKNNPANAQTLITQHELVKTRIASATSRLRALIAAHEQLMTQLSSIDPQSKVSTHAQLLRVERLATKLKAAHTYMLKVTGAAKGTNRVRKNFFRNAKIEHTAGCEVRFFLFGPDGALKYADSVFEYTSYTKPTDIGRTNVGTQKP
jgi:hypothetical protein